ncbi:hypothetical protein IEQ34_006811 [Dendrobium chrysotoxum]|uniref:Uncharacterized protein n=1 Tax=Dendrobium chrysotoxum TaxID=161865 RepID=A0AAV7GQB3_DENCH|nr:hypothetical protein IEQ34_006811 [Dendrobium chrysotoxum]
MAHPIYPNKDDDDYEAYEGNSFIYKRRWHHLSLVGRLPADSAEELWRNHRERKKWCLITIHDKKEDISTYLLRLAPPPPEATFEAGTSSIASPHSYHLSSLVINDLILEEQHASIQERFKTKE